MTIPKKCSRLITVDGEVYRWYLHLNRVDKGWRHIAIQHSEISGQVLLFDPYGNTFEIRPKVVRAAIQFALKQGWNPRVSGKPIFIGYGETDFMVLPLGKEFRLKD